MCLFAHFAKTYMTKSKPFSCLYGKYEVTASSNLETGLETRAPLILPFGCKDPAPILCLRFCVNVWEAVRGEIMLRHRYASGGSIRGAVLANQTSVNG